jgi:RNA polymerase sigma-70 factor (ECF subfamily)
MMRGVSDEAEAEITALARDGQIEKAATRALEVYGAELFGFLVHLLGNDASAADVFAQASEDFWNGLPKFQYRCSIRTWLYVLARHAAARFRRTPWNRGDRRAGGDSRIQSMAALARSRTQPWLRTDVKDRFAVLRDSLDPDDRTLLTLRIDRDMAWQDIARVTLEEDVEPDAATLGRETDRLRKRFQLLKNELRKRAEQTGLLDRG